jgi:hypothetical protein
MGIGFYRNHLFLFQTSYGVNNYPVVSKEARMDWAAFFKENPVLVGALIATIPILISNLVQVILYLSESRQKKRSKGPSYGEVDRTRYIKGYGVIRKTYAVVRRV